MKRFLLRTLLFLALATTVMTVLDLVLSAQLRERQAGPFSTWTDIFHSRITADLVVMGTSRAWVQYSPAILDSVLHTHSYNLGHDGSAFNRQYSRYLIYRKHNTKPRIIIQNIDFTTLNYTSGYDQYQYFPYFRDPDIRHMVIPYEQFTLADRTLPFYRYANFGTQRLFSNKHVSIKGYCSRERDWNVAPLERGVWTDYSADPRTLKMFEQFLAQASAEGIQVIFVHAPIFAGLTAQQQGLDTMWDIYRRLATQYHIPILNYQNDTICSDTTCFHNRTHLNRKGAELFSRQLANDLKKGHLVDISAEIK